MAKITVEIELSAEQNKLLEAYIEGNCFDLDKWIKRMVYMGIYSAVGKYKQPVGKIAAAFNQQEKTIRGKGKK
jgi:tRNA U38,U39,U40 pseudouridine synthase TruA